MKTPEEIKKGLSCLSITDFMKQYEAAKSIAYTCVSDVVKDALAYINKLESHVKELVAANNRLDEKIAQVERERDAAVKCVYDVHEEVFKPVSATLDAEKTLTNVGAIIAKWLLDTARAENTEGEPK